jgi:hypothetical protein
MAAWLLLALMIRADSTGPSDGKDLRQAQAVEVRSLAGTASQERESFDHVRAQEPAIRRSIVEGYSRSATFREVVDAVEALSCIVYIVTTVRLSDGMRGALLHNPAGEPGQPLLRILVAASLSPEERMSVIAHELQHVVEAVKGGPLRDAIAMTGAFRDLDPAAAQSHKFDTDAAVAVIRKVRDELARTRP